MQPEDQSVKIIGNESDFVYEIVPGERKNPANDATPAVPGNHPVNSDSGANKEALSNDLATNDGGIVETLDTAFHNKPGVSEGINPSGSNRADYYEKNDDGKTDAEEEVRPAGE